MSNIVVVMGVSGVGKTTVAKGVSALMGWEFAEGDAFHPQANVDKMHAGTPLTDEDRWPWLRLIREWMSEAIDEGRSAVVTCSALRRSYRDLLRKAGPEVRFLHLVAGESLIGDRLAARRDHFMPPSLLHSQFEALEDLDPDELDDGSVVVSVDGKPATVLQRCMDALDLTAPVDLEEGHRA